MSVKDSSCFFYIPVCLVIVGVLSGCDGQSIIDDGTGDNTPLAASSALTSSADHSSTASSEPECSGIDVLTPDGSCGHVDSTDCPPSWRDNPQPGYFCLGYADDDCRDQPQSDACLESCTINASVHPACDDLTPSPAAHALLAWRWELISYGYVGESQEKPLPGSANHLEFDTNVTSYAGDTAFPFEYTEDCNTVTGEYSLDGNTLMLDRKWTTQAFCSGQDDADLQDQISFISNVFNDDLVFSLYERSLTLKSNVNGQLTYSREE